MNKLKILNDPIYGFITIPNSLIFDLIEHKYFQRLRRISQMGLSYLVFPGAHHTRFHHALGCMHLMSKAVQVLRFKGIKISSDEENMVNNLKEKVYENENNNNDLPCENNALDIEKEKFIKYIKEKPNLFKCTKECPEIKEEN